MTCGCIENHLNDLVLLGIVASIPIVVYLYWKYIKPSGIKKPDKLMTRKLSDFYGYNNNPDGIE